jgi:hypothetical protein
MFRSHHFSNQGEDPKIEPHNVQPAKCEAIEDFKDLRLDQIPYSLKEDHRKLDHLVRGALSTFMLDITSSNFLLEKVNMTTSFSSRDTQLADESKMMPSLDRPSSAIYLLLDGALKESLFRGFVLRRRPTKVETRSIFGLAGVELC